MQTIYTHYTSSGRTVMAFAQQLAIKTKDTVKIIIVDANAATPAIDHPIFGHIKAKPASDITVCVWSCCPPDGFGITYEGVLRHCPQCAHSN